MTDLAPSPRPRLPAIDIARGVAILLMVIYHLCWDLSYFRFIAADVGYDLPWVIFARTILSAFLFLVGVGLALGHTPALRWRSFWRRWLFVLLAGLAITIATFIAFPETFVYFGVLHAIALFMLLALPFLRAPWFITALVALAVLVVPRLYADPLFNEKPWSWLGFWITPPPANDLVPIFPWFAVMLLGLLAAQGARATGFLDRLVRFQPRNAVARGLAWAGRWSLVIYLVHQLALLAILYPLSLWLRPDIAMRSADFLGSCQTTCEAGGTTAPLCTTYCQCGLAGIEQNDLWEAVYSGVITPEQQALLDASNRQCSVLIYPELDAP